MPFDSGSSLLDRRLASAQCPLAARARAGYHETVQQSTGLEQWHAADRSPCSTVQGKSMALASHLLRGRAMKCLLLEPAQVKPPSPSPSTYAHPVTSQRAIFCISKSSSGFPCFHLFFFSSLLFSESSSGSRAPVLLLVKKKSKIVFTSF